MNSHFMRWVLINWTFFFNHKCYWLSHVYVWDQCLLWFLLYYRSRPSLFLVKKENLLNFWICTCYNQPKFVILLKCVAKNDLNDIGIHRFSNGLLQVRITSIGGEWEGGGVLSAFLVITPSELFRVRTHDLCL